MYQLIANTDTVRRLRDGAAVPADDGNADWREYQAWLEAGNVPRPADPTPPPPPATIGGNQLARALIRRGVLTLDQVLAERSD